MRTSLLIVIASSLLSVCPPSLNAGMGSWVRLSLVYGEKTSIFEARQTEQGPRLTFGDGSERSESRKLAAADWDYLKQQAKLISVARESTAGCPRSKLTARGLIGGRALYAELCPESKTAAGKSAVHLLNALILQF